MTMPADIAELARALLCAEVAVATVDIARGNTENSSETRGALFPQERAAIARATPARQQEFTAGRRAARLAMQRLGVAPAAIPMGDDRAPVWPAALVGSISHSGQNCIAVVALKPHIQSLGIDIESDDPLPPDLTEIICTEIERNWLEHQPADQRGILAKVIFSAKECAYKCQYPLSHTLIDFSALTIALDPASGRFEAAFMQDVGPFAVGACLEGRYAMKSGMIICAMLLRDPIKTTIPD